MRGTLGSILEIIEACGTFGATESEFGGTLKLEKEDSSLLLAELLRRELIAEHGARSGEPVWILRKFSRSYLTKECADVTEER